MMPVTAMSMNILSSLLFGLVSIGAVVFLGNLLRAKKSIEHDLRNLRCRRGCKL